MSAVSAIYKLLIADAALALRVLDRIYCGNYPTTEGGADERPVSPYIIIEEITTVPAKTLKGTPKAERAIIQIDVISENYRDIKEVRDLVRAAIGTQASEIDTGSQWEAEVRMYRETMEWSIWSPR